MCGVVPAHPGFLGADFFFTLALTVTKGLVERGGPPFHYKSAVFSPNPPPPKKKLNGPGPGVAGTPPRILEHTTDTMSTKVNYQRITTEWEAMRAWKEAEAAGEKRMGPWLEENGHIAATEKGQKRGQDYIRFIQMNSKISAALGMGEEPMAFIARMVAEAKAKAEAQEKTGRAKVLLKKRDASKEAGEDFRAPREVRPPAEEAGGGRERMMPNTEELEALLRLCVAVEARLQGQDEVVDALLRDERATRARVLLEKAVARREEKAEARKEAKHAAQMALARALDAVDANGFHAQQAAEEEEEEEEERHVPPAPEPEPAPQPQPEPQRRRILLKKASPSPAAE